MTEPDHLARLDSIREAARFNWLVAVADEDLAAACWAAGEVRRLRDVAGSLAYALEAVRRMHSSGQFHDKGGPAMVEMALEVARRAGIEAGENPHDVLRKHPDPDSSRWEES